jgi:hypothetical protein
MTPIVEKNFIEVLRARDGSGADGLKGRPGRHAPASEAAHLHTGGEVLGLHPGVEAATNVMAETALRTADLYVFAVHAHRDKATADVLDVLQWEFLVLPVAVLNERCPRQKSIGLAPLLKLGPVKAGFRELGDVIADAGRTARGEARIVGSGLESSATGSNGVQQVAGMMPIAAVRVR